MPCRGVICAIYGCNNYRQQSDRKSFYRFPRNKELCKQWIIRSKRADLDEIFKKHGPEQLNKSHYVCSDHFVEKDFRNKNLLSQGLWPGSVPSVFLHQQKINLRASPKKRKREEEVQEESAANVQCKTDYSNSFQVPVTKDCDKCLPLMSKYRALQKTVSRQRAVISRLRSDICHLRRKITKCNSVEPNVCQDVAVPSSSTTYGDHSYTVACPENEHQTEEVKQMKAMLQCDVPHETKITDDDCLPVKQEVCDDTEDNACENKEFEFIAVKQECLEDNDMNVSQDDDCLQVKQEMCDDTEDNDCENKEFEFIAVKQEPLEDDDVNLSQEFGVDQVVKEEKDEKEEVSHQLHSNEDLECDTTLIKEEVDLGVDSVLGP